MAKIDQFVKSAVEEHERMKEAERVIARQREELDISNTTEKNLRLQLTKTQDRLISLRQELHKIRDVLGQLKNHEKVICNQGETISTLVKKIEDIREDVSKKLSSASVEKTLSMKVYEQEKQIQEQDNMLNLIRIENQVTVNKKDAEIQQLRKMLDEMAKENHEIKFEKDMVTNAMHRAELINSKKIQEMTEKIQKLDKNYNRVTDNPPVRDKRLHVTWADAARQSIQENVVSSQGAEDIPASQERRPVFILKTPRKTQTPLAIQAVKDDQPKRKRLYSNNSNHFLD